MRDSRRFAYVLVSVGLLLGAMLEHVQAEDRATNALPAGYRSVSSDKSESMRQLCQATADTGLFSGAVLVAKGGKVIYKGAFGMANREWMIANATDTKFRLASVSKQFCSMLVMQLVQEGRLTLSDSISKHLTYYRRDNGDRITIHHLLSHQSGLRDFTSRMDYRTKVSRTSYGKDEFIKLYCSGDLINDPGAIYSYCNAGYCILGRIVEKATGKTFERAVQERIFEPLGMKDSGVDRNQKVLHKRASGYTLGPFGLENASYIEMDSTPGPAGGLYSTVEDMFLWDRALTTDKLLSKNNRDLMFTPNREVPEVKAAGGRPHSIYGYGWKIDGRSHPVTKHRIKVINHGGAIHGFRAMENRIVSEDAFVIVLSNYGDPVGGNEVWNAINRLSLELTHIVTDQPFRMPAKKRLSQDQRLYQLIDQDGMDAAIQWFGKNGKRAAWGGTFMALSQRFIDEGRVELGLELMQRDVAMTPGKVWLLRKTSQAFLDHASPEQAIRYAEQGLAIRPNDETLKSIMAQAQAMRERTPAADSTREK